MLKTCRNSDKLLFADKNFPRRVFYTTLFVSALILLASLKYQSFELTISLFIGVFVSFCSAIVLWRWINYTFKDFDPEANSQNHESLTKVVQIIKSSIFAFMGIGKIFILGIFFFLIFKFISINIIALFIGISIVQIVMLLMIVSMMLVNTLNKTQVTGYKPKKLALAYNKVSLDRTSSNGGPKR